MSTLLRQQLFDALDALVLIDPHTHIDPRHPAGRTLTDVLGYHYFTELIHSAGVPRESVEAPGLDPKERFGRLVDGLAPLENTIQYTWLIELSQKLFGFADERITPANWEPLYDEAARRMAAPDWPQEVLRQSRIEALFLTSDFDDPLNDFDTRTYVPCLRTDDLVFHLHQPAVRERLERASKTSISSAAALRKAIGRLLEHFTAHGARACAISLPPDFAPGPIDAADAEKAVQAIFQSTGEPDPLYRGQLAQFVFWTLAEYCQDFRLPFDLMIGVLRGVYEGGVYQGRDLYDSRISLIQYKRLFNAFPRVTFPISVIASVMNQELTSYAWIFPNVVTSSHWWYSNTPTFIEHDLSARLEAVPSTKQIGYYSDMYKLEFGLPKFAMYKRLLAKVLADRFVIERGWSEERAIELGRRVLRGNVERVFYAG